MGLGLGLATCYMLHGISITSITKKKNIGLEELLGRPGRPREWSGGAVCASAAS